MWKDKVKEIIYILENSDVEEIDITFWGKRIRVSKSGGSYKMSGPPVENAIELSPGLSDKPLVPQSESPAESIDGESILSPMPGTFYRSPTPEADPFINEGDIVKMGQTLCIIEAMKIMNEIEAEQDGVIQKITAQDGNPVEFNQPLFVIKPS